MSFFYNIKTKIVLMTEEESKEYISKIKQYHFISNIVATKEDDRAFNIKSISTTVSKMTTGDIYADGKLMPFRLPFGHLTEGLTNRPVADVDQ